MDTEDPIIDEIMLAIENGQNVVLNGSGGVGKTYLLRHIARTLTKQGKCVYCCATTGVAAINLSVPEALIAGKTLHSWAGVGLAQEIPSKLIAKVKYNEKARNRWRNTHLLIIDEISMLGAEFFDKLDVIGREIRTTPGKPFGGLQLVLSGDFLQLPPVNDKWVFESRAFKELKYVPFILEKPKRYPDLNFFAFLLRVRKGQHNDEDIAFLESRVVAYNEYKKKDASSKDLSIVKPTVLHSKKVDVEFENIQELEKLPGEAVNYYCIDTFDEYKKHARAEDYYKSLDDAIPKLVILKCGAQVMLKANLDVEAGLANGTRGVVLSMTKESVNVKWKNTTVTTITPHSWVQEDKEGKATRTQIPLVLAYAMTVHKAQGSTLDYAILNIGTSIFCPGQAYVALSRVRESNGLLISEFYPKCITANEAALEFSEMLVKLAQPEEPSNQNEEEINEIEVQPLKEETHVHFKDDNIVIRYILNYVEE
jgi:ATP-dependent DNA helicase PIF1